MRTSGTQDAVPALGGLVGARHLLWVNWTQRHPRPQFLPHAVGMAETRMWEGPLAATVPRHADAAAAIPIACPTAMAKAFQASLTLVPERY